MMATATVPRHAQNLKIDSQLDLAAFLRGLADLDQHFAAVVQTLHFLDSLGFENADARGHIVAVEAHRANVQDSLLSCVASYATEQASAKSSAENHRFLSMQDDADVLLIAQDREAQRKRREEEVLTEAARIQAARQNAGGAA